MVRFWNLVDGLPPKKDGGTFIGFDDDDKPYILRWSESNGFFLAVGFDPTREEALPWSVIDMAGFIVRHIQFVEPVENDLSAEDQAIIEDYLARRTETQEGEVPHQDLGRLQLPKEE